MTVNYHVQKTRLRADRRYHADLLQAIYANPDCLAITGLSNDTLIWKASDSYVPVMIARVPAIVAYGTKVSFDFPQPPTPCHLGYYIETAKHVN